MEQLEDDLELSGLSVLLQNNTTHSDITGRQHLPADRKKKQAFPPLNNISDAFCRLEGNFISAAASFTEHRKPERPRRPKNRSSASLLETRTKEKS